MAIVTSLGGPASHGVLGFAPATASAVNAKQDGKSYHRTVAQTGSNRPFRTLILLRGCRTALI